MNVSKKLISIAVASVVGAAGYAIAQQTGAGASTPEGPYSAGASNPNVPSAGVSGAVGETSGSTGTMDSSRRMNSDGTMRDRTIGQSSGSSAGEPQARADRN